MTAKPLPRPRRRDLVRAGAALAAGASLSPLVRARESQEDAAADESPRKRYGRFGLKYAPHFGLFSHLAGDGLVDQLRFMADEGFVALEDNWMARRPADVQEELAKEMERLGMQMGVFVAHATFGDPTFVLPPAEAKERIQNDMRAAVEVAQRVNARWCTVVPGAYVKNVQRDYQTANVVDNLRYAAEVLEPAGLVAVLEPLNEWVNHAGVYLSEIPQAYLVCRAVDSPSVKILDDLYHQQITEGHLIRNIDAAWSEIAYVQVGDNPGRKEPGTGEIHYVRVFEHLASKGYDGIVGMEHGKARNSAEGERALIDAYVAADART